MIKQEDQCEHEGIRLQLLFNVYVLYWEDKLSAKKKTYKRFSELTLKNLFQDFLLPLVTYSSFVRPFWIL